MDKSGHNLAKSGHYVDKIGDNLDIMWTNLDIIWPNKRKPKISGQYLLQLFIKTANIKLQSFGLKFLTLNPANTGFKYCFRNVI